MASHRVQSAMVLATALLALLLAGCGGAPAAGPVSQDGRYGSSVGDSTTGDTSGDTSDEPADPAAPVLADTAFIVREGTLAIEVTDLPAAVQQAQVMVTGLGGYVSGSEERNDTYEQFASITYRVPVERWFEALNGLRTLGQRVVSENTDAIDVTADVVDLDARLANLHASEAQYQAIMLQANTIDDVLKVQKVLNDVRGEIEQLQAQRDNLGNRAALATLTVNWQVPTTATAAAGQGWELGREVDRAVATLVTLTQGLATLVIWLAIGILPVVIPIGLVAFVGYRLLRPRRKRVTMEANIPADG